MMVGAATVFVVTDIAKSTEPYRDVPGFTAPFEYGTATFYVRLCRDEVALHLLWCRGCWQPIAIWAALQALLAGATLAVKSDGEDRANGHARRERER
jgi:hypothetical protein